MLIFQPLSSAFLRPARGYRREKSFRDQAALHGQLEVETLDVVKPETITALRQRLAGRRFDVLLIVVGRKSQSLPSYLKETFTFVR